jgi:hypothetical protein
MRLNASIRAHSTRRIAPTDSEAEAAMPSSDAIAAPGASSLRLLYILLKQNHFIKTKQSSSRVVFIEFVGISWQGVSKTPRKCFTKSTYQKRFTKQTRKH